MSFVVGQFHVNKGVYWEPKINDVQTFGRIYDVFASAEDIKGRDGTTLWTSFWDTADEVAAIRDLHGHAGALVTMPYLRMAARLSLAERPFRSNSRKSASLAAVIFSPSTALIFAKPLRPRTNELSVLLGDSVRAPVFLTFLMFLVSHNCLISP